MTQYLISFGAHAMDHIPGEDAPAVARAAHAAVQEAINAGGDVPAAPDRTRPAALQQDLPWRPGNAGLPAHTGRMPVRLHHIVADAHDLPRLARFWTQALGWKVLSERDREIVIGTTRSAACEVILST
jgi:hypothetical protein